MEKKIEENLAELKLAIEVSETYTHESMIKHFKAHCLQ